MAKFAREAQWSYPIRNLATRIVHHVPSKQVAAELGALYTWVRDNIRYRFDPLGMEWIQRPDRTVLEQAGDCDDMATLLAALSGALGHAWRFRTVGTTPTVQKHVAVEAFDGVGWVTLDPVLEPPALSTLPRADLGRFGHRALGADHIWDPGGNMLSGKTTPRDRELWEWVAYYPPIAPASHYGNVPQPGAWTTPDPRYRSASVAGRREMPRHRTASPKVTTPAPAKAVMVSGLGQFPYTTQEITHLGNGVYRFYNSQLGAWGFLKKIGRAIGKGVHAVGKLARSSIVQGAANVIMPGAGAALKKGGETEAKAERTFKQIRTAVRHGPGAVLKEVVGRLPIAGGAGGALLKAGLQVGASAIAKSAQHKPQPNLKRKYPKNARQTWDARAGLYRVFAPRSGVAGFGAIRPSLTFALGASSSTQATAAVNAVKAFMRSSGNKAPQVALSAVRTFQAADGLLKADGLWGPNARVAAAYYLGANVASLPPVAAPYAKTKVTWIPPGARAQAKAAGAPIPAKAIQPTPAVAAAPPAPAGADYVQVGTEKNNPGLPPIGATPVASSSALPSKPTPAPAPGAVPVAVSAAAAPPGATHAIVTTPTGAQVIVPVASAPKAKKKKRSAAAVPTVVTLAPPAGATPGAAVAVLPVQAPPPAFPPPQGGPFGPGETPTQAEASSSGGNSQLMWAAIAYLWWQQQKKRRAA